MDDSDWFKNIEKKIIVGNKSHGLWNYSNRLSSTRSYIMVYFQGYP